MPQRRSAWPEGVLMPDPKVLFDASQTTGFEAEKKKHMRSIRLILINGTVGTPAIFAFVWFFLEFVISPAIDSLFLGMIFIILIILDELVMFNVVRPMLTNAWKYPPKITSSGVEFAGRSIPFREIGYLSRSAAYVMIGIAGKDAKYMVLNGHIGDVDGFISVFRRQAPNIAFRDLR